MLQRLGGYRIVYSDQIGHQTSEITLLGTTITHRINPPTPPLVMMHYIKPPPPSKTHIRHSTGT